MSEKQTKWRWGDEINPKDSKPIEEGEGARAYSSVEALIKNEPEVVVEIIPTTNDFDESESVPMRNISVGLYGNTTDKSFEEKVSQIQAFLTKNGGTCEVIRKTVSKTDADILVEFRATIPEWFANQHHAFDSVLNSTTNGFGVAWVEDTTK